MDHAGRTYAEKRFSLSRGWRQSPKIFRELPWHGYFCGDDTLKSQPVDPKLSVAAAAQQAGG